MSCKTWQDDDYEWPEVAQPPAALPDGDFLPKAPPKPPDTTAPPFVGMVQYVGPVANAAETIIADTSAQGPSTSCTVYINAQGDTKYNSATVKFYAVISGIVTQVGSSQTMPASADSSSHDFTFRGEAADFFQVTLTPTSSGATKQLVVAITGYGRESFGAGATSGVPGSIQLTGDLGGTAASPTVVGLTGTSNVVAFHGTTLQIDSGVTAWTLNQAGNGPSGGTAQPITISPQPANAAGNSVSGSVDIKLVGPTGTGAEAHFAVWTGVAGSQNQFFLTKANDTQGYSQPYLYMGSPATAPTTSNYVVFTDSSLAQFNAPSGSGTASLAVANTNILTCTSTQIQPQVGIVQWPKTITTAQLTQAAQTTDTLPSSITVNPQGPSGSATGANRFGGSLIVNKAAATAGAGASDYGGIIVQSNGTQCVTIGTYQEASGYGAIYFGTVAPSGVNFGFLGNATQTYLNVPSGGSLYLAFAGTSANGITITQTLMTLTTVATVSFAGALATPLINQIAASGNGQTLTVSAQSSNAANGNGGNLALTGGDLNGSGTAGTVSLNVGAASPSASLTIGPNGLSYANSAVTINSTGNTTFTQAQYQSPLITINTITLTGAATLIFPNVAGVWLVDVTAITLGGFTLAYKSGSATSPTISTLTSNSTIHMVRTTGSNGISVNV